MKLSELNESAKLNNKIVVYLDKENKAFRLSDSGEIGKRGLTKTITNEYDLEKIIKVYKHTDKDTVDMIKSYLSDDFDNFHKSWNNVKKQSSDPKFRKVLYNMQKDLTKHLARRKRK